MLGGLLSFRDAVCAELLAKDDVYLRRNCVNGPSASRNPPLNLAQGRCVLFLDDDAWHPKLLAQLYDYSAVRQGCPVYVNCSMVQESRRPEGVATRSETGMAPSNMSTDDVYVRNQVHMSGYVPPGTLLDGVPSDTYMRAYEAWEFVVPVFDRQVPGHASIMGTCAHEVSDDRGGSRDASHCHAVLEYLYVDRRHPAPRDELKQKCAAWMATCGLAISSEVLS